MTQEEANQLIPGAYRFTWIDESKILALVSRGEDGQMEFVVSPPSWVTSICWELVKFAELVGVL